MISSKITEQEWKYPQSTANKSGLLQVSGQHQIYWEEHGNPQGEPVMVVHGGPGGASEPSYARYFDPKRYRIILFDQRGCGKSIPNASKDPKAALAGNDTRSLIADMTRLRDELDITGKMHVFGGSWGSTLSMAYAIAHPETVETLILRGIFLGRRQDLEFFYQGNAAGYENNPYDTTLPGTYQVFPEAWKPFVEIIAPEKRGDMVKAYADIFAMTPKNERERKLQDEAAKTWSVWEGATSYLSQDTKDLGKFAEPEFAKAFAKIENHYFMNGCFLGGSGDTNRDNNYLLENIHKVKDIPVHIVQGRYDQVCPIFQAEELVAALKAAKTKSVDYQLTVAGHSMKDRATALALVEVMDNLPGMKGPAAAKKPEPSARKFRT